MELSSEPTVETSSQGEPALKSGPPLEGRAEDYDFDAFCSYSTAADYSLVRKVESFLESFHKLTSLEKEHLRPLRVCVDGSDFRLRAEEGEIPEILQDNLSRSRYLLLFASAGAAGSPWVDVEIAWFLKNRGRGAILVALTEGNDPTARPEEVFSPRMMDAGLHRKPWYDLRQARGRQAKGWSKVREREDEQVRLAAHLNDRTAGEVLPLWFREQRRGQRWRLTLATAAIVVLLIAAIVFYLQRQEVARQRTEANRQRGQAEAERHEAEGNLARAFFEKGDRAWREADTQAAGIFFARALTLRDEPEVRQRLLETRTRSAELLWVSPSRSQGALRFSPDASFLAVGGGDRKVHLWNLATGREVKAFAGHGSAVRTLAFDDGFQLASADYDGTILLWNTREDRPLGTLAGHADAVLAMAFEPGGKRLVSIGDDDVVRIWETGSRRKVREFFVSGKPSTVAIHPQGLQAAFGDEQGGVRLWDLQSGKEVRRIAAHSGHIVQGLAFSPDGRRLASGARDEKQILIWDAATGAKLREVEAETSIGFSLGLSFGLSGDRLAAAFGTKVQVWNLAEGKDYTLSLDSLASGDSLAFSPTGQWLATAGDSLRLWDAATGLELHLLPGHGQAIYGLAFSPDGRRIASASFDDTMRLWDRQTGRELRTYAHEASVLAVAFNKDGTRLASGDWNGNVLIWNPERPESEPVGHFAASGIVQSLAFHPNQAQVAVATDRNVGVWSTETLQPLWGPLPGATEAAVFEPGGKLLVTAGGSEIVIREADSGMEIRRITVSGSNLANVSVSPDGRLIAAPTKEGEIKLYRLESGEEVATLRPGRSEIQFAVFSPDSQRLFTAGYGESRLFDVRTRREILNFRSFLSFPQWLSAGAFSPDGNAVALGNNDGSIELWQVERSVEMAMLRGQSEPVLNLAFDSSSRRLAAAASDGTVRIWDPATRHEIAVLRGASQAVDFTSAGELVTGDRQGAVHVWDLKTQSEQRVLSSGSSASFVRLVAANPKGGEIAAGLSDQTRSVVWLWNSQGGPGREILKLERSVEALAWSPDGRLLASGGSGQVIHIWDREAGKERSSLTGSRGTITHLAFSADGQRLASTSRDGAIRVWNLRTGNPLLTLGGQILGGKGHWMEAVALRADGLLAAVGDNGRVFLRTLPSGRPRATVSLFDHPILHELENYSWLRDAVFSPDGRWLAISSGSDTSVSLWDMPAVNRLLQESPAQLMAQAQRNTGLLLSGVDLVSTGSVPTVLPQSAPDH